VQQLKKLAADVAGLFGGSVTLENAVGALHALKLQAERAADLEGEVSALKNAIEAEKREQLIAKLSADGKLPPSQQAWAREQTLANLESFARCAPVVVQAEAPKERAPENGALTLSDEERRIASIFGHSEEELLKSKRLLAEGKVV
jgi:phage I-like protein